MGYLIALAAGVIVGAIAVIALKSFGPSDADTATVDPHDHREPTHPRRTMPSKTVVVGSAVGLQHARPRRDHLEAAADLDSEVLIGIPGDEAVDASPRC